MKNLKAGASSQDVDGVGMDGGHGWVMEHLPVSPLPWQLQHWKFSVRSLPVRVCLVYLFFFPGAMCFFELHFGTYVVHMFAKPLLDLFILALILNLS